MSNNEFTTHIKNKYKEWKCDSCINKYCKKCNKSLHNTDTDSICCDKCNYWYHLPCSNLSASEFKCYIDNTNKIWKCNSCINLICKKCDITLFKKENILFNICKNKYHLKCSGLTKDFFKKIKNKEDAWNCRNCYSDIFPFHQIDNQKLEKLIEITKKTFSSININKEDYTNWCNICNKKVIQPRNSLPCTNCKTFIHKKRSKLNRIGIQNFHIFKGKWECTYCLHEKYPFTEVKNDESNNISYNSSMKYQCNTKVPHVMIDNNLKLLLTQTNQKESWNSYKFDIENEFEKNIEIKPNFKYYEVHDFDKMKELWENKPKLSIFHTNICSLNAENMEDLVHDMDFNFDVLAVTETWNPDKTKDKFSPHHIEGYQKY